MPVDRRRPITTEEAVAAALTATRIQQAADVAKAAADAATSVAKTAAEAAVEVAKVSAQTARCVDLLQKDMSLIVTAMGDMKGLMVKGFHDVNVRQDKANGTLVEHDKALVIIETKALMSIRYQSVLWLGITTLVGAVVWFATSILP